MCGIFFPGSFPTSSVVWTEEISGVNTAHKQYYPMSNFRQKKQYRGEALFGRGFYHHFELSPETSLLDSGRLERSTGPPMQAGPHPGLHRVVSLLCIQPAARCHGGGQLPHVVRVGAGDVPGPGQPTAGGGGGGTVQGSIQRQVGGGSDPPLLLH